MNRLLANRWSALLSVTAGVITSSCAAPGEAVQADDRNVRAVAVERVTRQDLERTLGRGGRMQRRTGRSA
jgi:hypothetical protein